MPPAKQWAITQLGEGTSLELIIETEKDVEKSFDVCQYTSTWAMNEIPSCQCMLAIGREVRELVRAEIHASAARLRQMRKCRIIFRPKGEYDPDGTKWPEEFVIFRGYFMGLAYNKINGKVNVVANLKHWLVDLACSSCLTSNSHAINPAHLTAPAVLRELNEEGASDIHYVSQTPGVELVREDVVENVWGGIKKLFCGLANIPTLIGSTPQEGNCGGDTGGAVKNTRALMALERIEGEVLGNVGDNCTKEYKYGVPLPLQLFNVHDAEDAVAKAVTEATVESYANTTFWDKLVGEYCPLFCMGVVPAVEYALVIADTPAYRNGPWKVIEPSEYDSFQMQADLERPLRAVGVVVQHGCFMGVPEGMNDQPVNQPTVGGCFAATIDDPDDGVVQYVTAPRWIQTLVTHEPYASGTTGLGEETPSRTDTTPDSSGGQVPPSTGTMVEDVNQLINAYARSVFVLNMLRGRSGTVGGKLRFDIAPGSIVKVRGSEEKFLAGEDELAVSIYGCVSRMTIAINAEGGIAGTTFQLSHLRTEPENGEDRTSVEIHPLFNNAIHGGGKHGSPLVEGHEDLAPDTEEELEPDEDGDGEPDSEDGDDDNDGTPDEDDDDE